jgi:hypothetical protein
MSYPLKVLPLQRKGAANWLGSRPLSPEAQRQENVVEVDRFDRSYISGWESLFILLTEKNPSPFLLFPGVVENDFSN